MTTKKQGRILRAVPLKPVAVTMKENLESSISLAMTAVEFGFKSHEKGWNLDQTLFEASKLLRSK